MTARRLTGTWRAVEAATGVAAGAVALGWLPRYWHRPGEMYEALIITGVGWCLLGVTGRYIVDPEAPGPKGAGKWAWNREFARALWRPLLLVGLAALVIGTVGEVWWVFVG